MPRRRQLGAQSSQYRPHPKSPTQATVASKPPITVAAGKILLLSRFGKAEALGWGGTRPDCVDFCCIRSVMAPLALPRVSFSNGRAIGRLIHGMFAIG